MGWNQRIAGLISILSLLFGAVYAQPQIYTGSVNLITGVWTGNCSATQISTENPFDGTTHYRINYSTTAWWCGWGMNMDNWGGSPALDFSGYDAIQLSYRGLSGTTTLNLQLRDANGLSTTVEVGGTTEVYTTVTLPMSTFLAGTSIDIENITELTFSTADNTPTYSGTVYVDGILLTSGSFEGLTTLQTWARFANMDKGVNFANWLEAAWLIPFNAYPDFNRFNRSNVQNLIDMGFNAVRLPICFEQLADPNPPYLIPPDHVVFDLIDSTILWSQQMGFNLIIDNHHGWSLTNANYLSEIPRKKAVWQQIIDRYGDLDPEQYFFEIYNEPTNAISNNNLHVIMDSVLATIRAGVPDHTVIVGGNWWNSIGGLQNTQPYADSNIVYTFHSYDPFDFTHQGMSWTDPPYMPAVPFPNNPNDSINLVNVIASAKSYSETYNVPVMLGEFGCSTQANATSRCNYISAIGSGLDAYNIPWYYWDVISPSDAFGFLDGNGDPIPCFAQALHLGSANTCANVVSNLQDDGDGSLRDQLQCAVPGDTIYFDGLLGGDTLMLGELPVFFNKNVTLINPAASKVVIDASESALLYISPDIMVHLENIDLVLRTTDAILNSGTLYLRNAALNIEGSDPFYPDGLISIGGVVIVK